MKKTICLFAGFDEKNKVQDYVVFYLQQLSEFADIYYLADCPMPQEELDKLAGFTKGAYAYRHGKYDFGSWQELSKQVTWPVISQYEQLIFANDSCYGPMFSFEEALSTMRGRDVDFWGMTHNKKIQYHLQSYFLVFNQSIIQTQVFQQFIDAIEQQNTFKDIVRNYEIGLTQLLLKAGYKAGAYVNEPNAKDMTYYPVTLLEQYRSTLIKVKCFLPKHNHLKQWYPTLKKLIQQKTSYDFSLIERHLLSKGTDLTKNDLLLYFQHPLLRWVYRAKITKTGRKVVKILGFPVYISAKSKKH
jgi:lipopolysaccharide biosynthesis protein